MQKNTFILSISKALSYQPLLVKMFVIEIDIKNNFKIDISTKNNNLHLGSSKI